ncbi:MAG: PrgI family protein [Patescibacteria group bacterium]
MQFKVPQNVQIEDKILPFMTLKQLIVCGVGGGFTYLIYLLLEYQNPEVWIPPVLVMGLLTLAVAFLKIRDIPFVRYMMLLIERYLNATRRSWIKSAGEVFPDISMAAPKSIARKTKTTNKKKAILKDLDKLSRMLDEGKK